jgi:hypothetical protein
MTTAAAVDREQRLGWVGTVVTFAVGIALAVVATRMATAALSDTQTFRAQARVAVVADDRVDLGPDVTAYQRDRRLAAFVQNGTPARVAAAILTDGGFAASATAPVAGSATVSAAVVPGSITVTVKAESAKHAERAVQALLDKGIPVAERLIGPVRLIRDDSPAGNAVSTGLPVEMVIAATAPTGYLLGMLLALAIRSAALHLRGRGAGRRPPVPV